MNWPIKRHERMRDEGGAIREGKKNGIRKYLLPQLPEGKTKRRLKEGENNRLLEGRGGNGGPIEVRAPRSQGKVAGKVGEGINLPE